MLDVLDGLFLWAAGVVFVWRGALRLIGRDDAPGPHGPRWTGLCRGTGCVLLGVSLAARALGAFDPAGSALRLLGLPLLALALAGGHLHRRRNRQAPRHAARVP
ncbi:hypothetical protein [Streptomyces termitum]|uniref:hypothetical protein n=1 Tax=Streptomyces termitum TaxID=67368 RepID=UPI0033B53DD8